MKLIRILLLAVLPGLAVRAENAVALLRPGEALTYSVGWGLLGHAGEINIGAQAETADGQDQILVTTTTSTRGFVRALYRFDGDAMMHFDAADGRLLSASASTQSKNENTRASISFDYAKHEAGYVDYLKPARSTTLALPEGQPMDMITALIQSRVWALSPGQSRDALVLFDDEFYPLKITAEKVETISTPDGPRKAVLLVPRMTDKPKGMFRKGGQVHVWVSADDERLPLRFEVKLKIGTAYAVLTKYQAPAILN
ncbi:MAG: DUF3108 domain-containing protein [Opitutaceae bacterium]|jgi:hypothetical protein